MGIKRNFSQATREKFKKFVRDTTATGWEVIGDRITDFAKFLGKQVGIISLSNNPNSADKYYKDIIDMKNTTEKAIDQIFDEAIKVDTRYGKGMQAELDTIKSITKFVKDLADTVDPNGGNMNVKERSKLLQSDISSMKKAKTTEQDIVEGENLGTDPKATKSSVDPVNLCTGNFTYEYKDIEITSNYPITFIRYYNSLDKTISSMGKGFKHNYDISISENNSYVDVTLSEGQHVFFNKLDDEYRCVNNSDLQLEKVDNHFVYSSNYENYIFGDNNLVSRIEDKNHNGLNIQYDNENQISKIETDAKDSLTFVYEDSYLVKIYDHTDRAIDYKYENGNLIQVTKGEYSLYYKYDTNGRLIELLNENTVLIDNTYDDNNRVLDQTLSNGDNMTFEYNDDSKEVVHIERNGLKTVHVHDDEFRLTEIKYDDGTSIKYVYNENKQCIKEVDRLGRVIRKSYDSKGNISQVIDPMRHKYNMTYDKNNKLLTVSVNGVLKLKNTYDANGNLLTSTDAMNNTTSLFYDEKGHVIKCVLPNNNVANYSYDSKGNVIQWDDDARGTSNYTYDNLNRLIAFKDGLGNEYKFELDRYDNCIKETNPLGDTKSYEYDQNGQTTRVVNENGSEIRINYNKFNLISEIIDELGNTTKIEYDAMWNISKVILPTSGVVQYEYDLENNLTKVINPLGGEIKYTYDLAGNVISETIDGNEKQYCFNANNMVTKYTDPEGNVTTYQYDNEDNLISVINSKGNIAEYKYNLARQPIYYKSFEGVELHIDYNEMGLVSSVTDALGKPVQFFYDKAGDKISKVQYQDGTTELFEFDLNGNRTSYTNKIGLTTHYQYDGLDRVVAVLDANNLPTKYEYDKVGNLISIIDHAGDKITYNYSLNNSLIETIDTLNHSTKYNYDNLGLLTSVQVGNGTTHYERDIFNNITKIIDDSGNEESFEYNAYGTLVKKIDRDGYVSDYSYNKNGLIQSIVYSDGKECTYDYDALGFLSAIHDWNGTTKYECNSDGQLTSVVDYLGNKVSYSYNNRGMRNALVYPDGTKLDYLYDEFGRVSRISNNENITDFTYDSIGRIQEKALSNSNKIKYTYTDKGLVKELNLLDSNSNSLESIAYDYNNFNQKIKEIRSSKGLTRVEKEFEYDSIGRISLTKNNGSITQYEYDEYGNRIKKIMPNDVINYTYNNLNQLISATSSINGKTDYTYDLRGNVTSVINNGNVINEYSYNALNRIEKASNNKGETNYYNYNGLGQRIENIISHQGIYQSTKYVIDPTQKIMNVLQKSKSQDNTKYVYDTGVLSAISNDNSSYFFNDVIGTSLAKMNGTGSIDNLYQFDEFGELDNLSDIDGLRYSGFEYDGIANTYYAYARQYRSNVGRFDGRDINKGNIYSPQSINEYAYCYNDPNDYIDQDGEFVITTSILIGVGICAAGNAIIDTVSQEIKIHEGKQEKFKWGEFAGSIITGGVSGAMAVVCPEGAVGYLATFAVNLQVGAASSVISQAIDDHSINVGKVAEDAIVNGVVSTAFKFLGDKIGAAVHAKWGESKKLGAKVLNWIFDGKDFTKKTWLEQLKDAGNSKIKDVSVEYWKSLVKKQAGNLIKTIVKETTGLQKPLDYVKDLTKDALKNFLPIYKSDSDRNFIQFVEDYVGTIYGKITGQCPLYV